MAQSPAGITCKTTADQNRQPTKTNDHIMLASTRCEAGMNPVHLTGIVPAFWGSPKTCVIEKKKKKKKESFTKKR